MRTDSTRTDTTSSFCIYLIQFGTRKHEHSEHSFLLRRIHTGSSSRDKSVNNMETIFLRSENQLVS
jgi:hypothetical protein